MDLILSLIALIVVLCVIAAIRIARTDTDIAIAAQAGRPQPGRAPIVDTRFRCTGCDYQTDSPPGAINHHSATHHRMVERAGTGRPLEWRWKCESCEYAALSMSSAALHHRLSGHNVLDTHAVRPRGLDPVTVRDGEVEEIGGGAR